MQKKLSFLFLPIFLFSQTKSMEPDPLASQIANPISFAPLYSRKTVAKIGATGTCSALAGGIGWVATLNQCGFDIQENPRLFYGGTLLVSLSSGLFGGWTMYRRSPNGLYHQAERIIKRHEQFSNETSREGIIKKLYEQNNHNYPLPTILNELENINTDLRKADSLLQKARTHSDATIIFQDNCSPRFRHLSKMLEKVKNSKKEVIKQEDWQTHLDMRKLNAAEQANVQKSPARKAFFSFLKDMAIKVIIDQGLDWWKGTNSEDGAI